jgi:AcrR family transcriptional regulator
MPAAPTRRTRPRGRSSLRAAARETASTVYKDAILAAARDEFDDRGYAATRMLDVARRAGMSVGALYRYFENKEDLFVSIMARASEEVSTRMRAIAAATPEPRERIGKLVETMLAFIEENRGMFLAFQQLDEADRAHCHAMVEHAGKTRETIQAVYRQAIADGIAAGTLRNDIPADDQLVFLSGAIHGFLEAWSRSGGPTRLVDKAPLIAHLTLRALGGSP